VQDHARLIAAIRSRDGDSAYVAMWQHIENVKQLLSAGEGFDGAGRDTDKIVTRGRAAGRRKLKLDI
jgi:hypothetical protein